jgi:hypothetical protein
MGAGRALALTTVSLKAALLRLSCAAANLTSNGSTPYAWLGLAMAAQPGVAVPVSAWLESLAPALSRPNVISRCKVEHSVVTSSGHAEINATLVALGAPGWRDAAQFPVGAVLVYALPAATSPYGRLAACIAGDALGPAQLPPPLYILTGNAGLNLNRYATSKFGAAVSFGSPLGPSAGLLLSVGVPCTDGNHSTGLLALNR